MGTYKRLIGLLLACGTLTVLLTPLSARGQSGTDTSLALSPSKFDVRLDAGQSVEQELVVDTFGSGPVTARLYAKPFSVKSETYEQVYEAQAGQVDPSGWVHIDAPSVTMTSQGNRQKVRFTLTAPNNATPGGYYAVLFAETGTSTATGATASLSSLARVGSLLYITVNGDVNTGGDVTDWNVPPVQNDHDAEASFKMSNNGNVHYTAKYSIRTKDIFNITSTTYNGETTLLPGTVRDIRITWPSISPFGIYKTEGTVDYLDGQKTLPTKIFVRIAKPVYWVVGIALIIVAVCLYRRYRRRNSGRQKDAGK